MIRRINVVISLEQITNVIVVQTIIKISVVGTQIEQCQTAIMIIIILIHRWDTKLIVTVMLVIVTKRDIMKEGIVIVHIFGVETTETMAIKIRDQETIELTGSEMNHYRLLQVRENRDTIVVRKITQLATLVQEVVVKGAEGTMKIDAVAAVAAVVEAVWNEENDIEVVTKKLKRRVTEREMMIYIIISVRNGIISIVTTEKIMTRQGAGKDTEIAQKALDHKTVKWRK